MDNSYPFHTNPGLFFTVPKQSKWAVHGQPTLPTSVPLGGTDFHSHIRSPNHQNRIYYTNSNTTAHNSFWAFTDSPKISKNSTIRSHVLGPILRPIPGLFHINTCILIQNFHTNSPKILGSHGWWEKSPIISNNSVPCFGTDQTAPHGLKLTETSKNP